MHVYIVVQDLIQTDQGQGEGVLILVCEMIFKAQSFTSLPKDKTQYIA